MIQPNRSKRSVPALFARVCLTCFFATPGLLSLAQTISGETVVIEETVNSDVTSSYLIVKSLTLTPKANGDPVIISAATDGDWHAKMIERSENIPPNLDKNFVRTEIARAAFTDENEFAGADADERRVSFSYSDGLGRSMQTVVANQSPGENDLIAFHSYDPTTGLETKSYLPYTIDTQNPGSYQTGHESNPKNYLSGYYDGTNGLPDEAFPYSETEIEDSPLGRVKAVTSLGQAWHNNTENDLTDNIKSTYEYFIYDPAVHGKIRSWKVITMGTPDKEDDEPRARANGDPTHYVAGELSIVQVINEQGVKSQKITDSRGLTIASRTRNGSSWVTTYNVYDDFGRLRFVVPPVLDKGTNLTTDQCDGYLFKYVYDERGRLIKEKKPGAGWVYHCYDKWDRVVMTQDAVQRLSDEWTFVKYDKHNRPIMTGLKVKDTDPDSWWNSAKNTSAGRYEDVTTDATGYTTDNTLPTVINDIYSIIYYDDYSFIDNTGWDAEGIDFDYINDFDEPEENTAIKGLTTGSKVRILETNTWLNTVVYYDEYYRAIQVISENHLGGYDRISSDLNWAGEVWESKLTHSKTSSGADLVYEQRYEYDHDGRLLKVWNELDDEGEILMAEYHYNELGTLIKKDIHSTDNGASFLQSIDYSYNAKGWLTAINDPALSEASDLFGAKYHYNETLSIAGGTDNIPARHDGALAAFEWQNKDTDGDNFSRSIVGYNYDGLGQLTSATYATGNGSTWTGNGGDYDEHITYADDNGNISRIIRNENGTEIDDLDYNYISNTNQLKGVGDNASGTASKGLDDYYTGATDYVYDANGNLTSDMNKQITAISYNHLNLPKSIELSGATIHYTYDAAGRRLSKTVKDADDNVIGKIDYVGGIEYYDDEINQVFTNEGRAYAQNGSFHYEYMITDHQGNNRVAYGILPERKVYVSDFEDGTDEPDFHVPDHTVLTNTSGQYNHTPAGVKSQHLTGETNKVVGAAKVLDISNGDKVSLEVWYKYIDSSTSGTNEDMASVVGALFSSSVGGVMSEATRSAISSTISANPSVITRSSGNNTALSAYLNYIFFNEDGSVDESLSGAIGVNGDDGDPYAKGEISDMTYGKSGYLYIYLANEQNNGYSVFFDDLKVTHESSNSAFRVTQANEYYAFGALMTSSWRNDGYLDPGLRYQSSFASYDSLIQQYDFMARSYDPYLGRFHAVDPVCQYASPYLGMGNSPAMMVDPMGTTARPTFLDEQDRNGGGGGSGYIGSGTAGGARYYIGQGSGNHWSDEYSTQDRDYFLMNNQAFGAKYNTTWNQYRHDRVIERIGEEVSQLSLDIFGRLPNGDLILVWRYEFSDPNNLGANLVSDPNPQSSGGGQEPWYDQAQPYVDGWTKGLGLVAGAVETDWLFTDQMVKQGRLAASKAPQLTKFIKGAGAVGLVVGASGAVYNAVSGNIQGSDILDIVVAGAAYGGALIAIGNPVALTAIAAGGVVYGGIMLFGGEEALNNSSAGQWVQENLQFQWGE